ncbi:MAG: ATP-binding protein, partial [Acidimicrobiales bacterium]
MDLLVADLLLSAEVRDAPYGLDQMVALSTLLLGRVEEFRNDHPDRAVAVNVANGVRVRGREDLLDRLLTNSFSNIIRHTARDTPVQVSLQRSGANALMTIEDGGRGLPEYGIRPQRFRRFDQSRSRETGGSGLGMSIMADIAESLGGSLRTSRSPIGGLALNFTFEVVP